jgi:hypothetical protein
LGRLFGSLLAARLRALSKPARAKGPPFATGQVSGETPRVICSVESLRHFDPAGCGYSHTAPREVVTERSDGGRHPCESFARVEMGGTSKDGKQRTEKAPIQPEAGPTQLSSGGPLR